MDRRSLLAISLCFLIYVGWQKYFFVPPVKNGTVAAQNVALQSSATTQAGAQTVAGQTSDQKAASAATGAAAPATNPKQTHELSLSGSKVLVSNESRFFSGWELLDYRWGETSATVPLQAVSHKEAEVEIAFEDPELSYLANVRGKGEEIPGGWKTTYEDAKVRIVREIKVSADRTDADLTIRATFLGDRVPKFAFISLESASSKADPDLRDRKFVYWSGEKVHRLPIQENMEQQQLVGPIHWIGATNRYFVFALVQNGPKDASTSGLVQPVGPYAGRMSMVYDMPAGAKEITIPLKVYYGPKNLSMLRAVDKSLDTVVDFGFFNAVAYPLLLALRFFHDLVGNWGVAIIFVTLIIRLLTIPLNWKGMKNMKRMAKYQPLMKELQAKHGDNKTAYQQEMMVFMKTHGLNPLAGCFPILIQMPVFFAYYQVLYNSIELYRAPFAFWIHDLSLKDPYYVTPILLTGMMWLQQKLTPNTATDPMQAKMLQFMPLMFGFFMISVPAGLTVYMVVNTATGIAQQFVFNKLLKNIV